MRRRASSQTTGAVLSIIGILVGAGLIFITLFATHSLSPKTTTETSTELYTSTSAVTTVSTVTMVSTATTVSTVTATSESSTSSATVTAQVMFCTATTDTCIVTLTNTGTSNVAVIGCTVQVRGVATPPATEPAGSITAGKSTSFTCGPPATEVTQIVGSMAAGQFSMSNGASVPFIGTWS